MEKRISLKEICENIANSVEKEEYQFWIGIRRMWFEEGADSVWTYFKAREKWDSLSEEEKEQREIQF